MDSLFESLGTFISQRISVTGLRMNWYKKYFVMIALFSCGILIFLLQTDSKVLGMKYYAQKQKPCTCTTQFPNVSRNDWPGHDTQFPNVSSNDWPGHDSDNVTIYILSVIGSNTTNHVMYERDVRLHGWIDARDYKKRIKCCFLWTDGTISEFDDPVWINKKRTSLMASQIACPFNASHSDVSGVMVTYKNSTCPSAGNKLYSKPFIPKASPKNESFAICLKLVYGNVDNVLFQDWLEFYRTINVDKIFMFTYNITHQTAAIIRHYVDLGLVEARTFYRPNNSKGRVGAKSFAFFEDERVIIFDCLQRSSGYKYLAILDMDEFVVPRKHGDVKELMKYLTSEQPNAAGFHLPSYIFDKTVKLNPRTSANGSAIVKYFERTPVLGGGLSRSKNILLPSRISANGLFTHQYRPNTPYKRGTINHTIVAINHYRNCYRNLEDVCSSELITDKYILNFVEKFQDNAWYTSKPNTTDKT